MDKVNGKAVKQTEVAEKNVFIDSAHKVVLAGAGAFGILQDETNDFFDRLLERGEDVEKDSRKRLDDVRERPKKQVDKATDRLTKEFEKLLNRLNIPTRTDIKALDSKVTALTQKVDELKKARV
jgi:poly(hydroxyalkanoate) granule-associated protein